LTGSRISKKGRMTLLPVTCFRVKTMQAISINTAELIADPVM
jgi:hypothetical protein